MDTNAAAQMTWPNGMQKKGLSEGYERRLTEIEYQLRKLNTDEGDLLLNEWNERYDAYRQLCIAHGFWNWVIGDRTTFVPTSYQMQLEKNKKDQILKMHGDWKQRMLENRILLDYLEKCPRKHAQKNQLMKPGIWQSEICRLAKLIR